MAVVISLQKVIEALEMAHDEATFYLDPDTGEVTLVTDEARKLVEVEDEESLADLPKWQQEGLPAVRAVLENERTLELPDKLDIHEWEIMKEFAEEQEDERTRRGLLNAIHGPGAFRSFKNSIYTLGIENNWYKFRQEALEKIARDWLEEHKLAYK